jgi:hypothetical protein
LSTGWITAPEGRGNNWLGRCTSAVGINNQSCSVRICFDRLYDAPWHFIGNAKNFCSSELKSPGDERLIDWVVFCI